MRRRYTSFLLATLLFFQILAAPGNAAATANIYEVNPADPTCTVTPNCYTTIPTAIQTALTSKQTFTLDTFKIMVEPGTYPGGFSLGNGIDLVGRETASTILEGGTAIITAATITEDTNVKNFTFQSAQTGVLIQNSTAHVKIFNNIFRSISGNAAVQTQASPNTEIVNNTFFSNSTGIIRDADTIEIVNNIFSNNSVGINQGIVPTQNSIDNNDFFSNTTNGPTGTSPLTSNPLFVPTAGDFHLSSGSPCINAGTNFTGAGNSVDGNTSDIGAYGGSNADTIPFQLSGVVSSTTSTTSPITVSWSANNSYFVDAYHVYYGFSPGDYTGTGATEGLSPFLVSGATSTTLSGLTSLATSTPAPPASVLTSPLNQSITVNWTPVSGATGYKIYYSLVSFSTTTLPSTYIFVDSGAVNSYPFTGLTNYQTYYFAVSAFAQPTVYIAVTALNNSSGLGPFTPGESFESDYATTSVHTGDLRESGVLSVVSDFPEPVSPYPTLPNKGCFIATAAYGHYSAPQVQALREFRDRYLMSSEAGRAFVAWYYHYGPIGAEYLNSHPWLKPLVRAALLPAIGGSLFLIKTSFIMKAFVLLLIAGFAFTLRRRKKLVSSGGAR